MINQELSENHEKESIALYNLIPKKEIDRVFNENDMIDICPSFLGFIAIYKYLSIIIPRHFTVIDFGCAYNAQSYLFTEHTKYIGVDNFPDRQRFVAPGTEFYDISIEDYIKRYRGELYLEETFAICSYVPPWGADNMKLVRENFINVFTYYPHGGYR